MNNEIPKIEIEDLSLELEIPDDPDKDKPWSLKHQTILSFFFNQLKKLGITQIIKVFFQKRLDFKVNFDYKHNLMIEHRSGQNRVLLFFQNQLIRNINTPNPNFPPEWI